MSNFGQYGGRYVPEGLMAPLEDLEYAFNQAIVDEAFMTTYHYYLKHYVGRPSPLYYADRLTKHFNKGKIYLKREDLNHTGAHKINNVIGQVLLAKRMGKKELIAETGAGQHGVATATVAAMFQMKCRIFMGEEDIKRQVQNVYRMKLLGAEVVAVTSGTCTLKDATNEAIREWVRCAEDTFYVIGSVVGPHPYPTMVREFQKVIGEEAKEQLLQQAGALPNKVYAAIGGGSNAMGIFHAFLLDESVELIGAEAAGLGLDTDFHASVLDDQLKEKIGVFQGMKTALLTNDSGHIIPAHSISAGLDYPGVGPEHTYLKSVNRAAYKGVTDQEAIEAFHLLTRTEGIIPALESAHAIALAVREIEASTPSDIILINVSGRGDKDMHTIMEQEA